MQNVTPFVIVRVFHILSGAAWVGGVIFIGRFLLPGVQFLGPAGGKLMQHLTQVARLPVYMMGVAIVTTLTGLYLYWHNAMAASGAWAITAQGRTFGIGGLFAIVAVIYGMAVTSPTAKRLGALAGTVQEANRPPTTVEAAELSHLQARLIWGSQLAALLLVVATLLMAVARYIP